MMAVILLIKEYHDLRNRPNDKIMKAPTLPHKVVEHDASLPHSLEANRLLSSSRMTREEYTEFIQMKKERTESFVIKTKLFFFIGLSLSLLFSIVIMNWKSYDKLELVDLGNLDTEFDDLMEVPVSTQPPPPPPKQVLTPIITEVDDAEIIEEIEVSLDVEMTEETEVQDHNIDFTMEPIEEEQVEEVFTIVENYPEPIGGMSSFYSYVGENIQYPAQARRLNVTGMVFIQFVVEKDGQITDVKVLKGIGAGCDEEAVRVLKSAPAWKPGKQRGVPVRVRMTVPIRFVLHSSF
jgi:protein TonB